MTGYQNNFEREYVECEQTVIVLLFNSDNYFEKCSRPVFLLKKGKMSTFLETTKVIGLMLIIKIV